MIVLGGSPKWLDKFLVILYWLYSLCMVSGQLTMCIVIYSLLVNTNKIHVKFMLNINTANIVYATKIHTAFVVRTRK